MSETKCEQSPRPIAWEYALAVLALVVCFGLRIAYIYRYRFDSDEPQHLHVVWEWLQGGIAYRDFFDNHVPLFHLLSAPILKLTGERADALLWMRLWQLPVFACSLFLTHRISSLLFSKRVALWAVVFLGLYPYYFYPTIEFRPDNLWGLTWLTALWVALSGRLGLARSFAVGLILGLDFSFSMKTSLLLASGILAVFGSFVVLPKLRATPPRLIVAALAAGLAGLLVVPAALLFYFSSQGALQPLYQCVIKHNLVAASATGHSRMIQILAVIPVFGGLLWGARRIAKAGHDETVATKRVLVFLIAGTFLTLLHGFWGIITRQDFIPNDPLLVLLVTPLILEGTRRAAGKFSRANAAALVQLSALLVIGVVWILLGRSLRLKETQGQIRYVSEVLSLTGPRDYVMDFKGEAIFRHRPFYYVLEPMTRMHVKSGTIVDDIPQRMIDTKTCVALAVTRRLSAPTDNFIRSNYLQVSQVSVAGRFVETSGDGAFIFDIKVPVAYVLIDQNGLVSGKLDGTQTTGTCTLSAGSHRFEPARKIGGKLAVLWQPAWKKGFSPFNPVPFEKFESEF
jgi:hypothetical protein